VYPGPCAAAGCWINFRAEWWGLRPRCWLSCLGAAPVGRGAGDHPGVWLRLSGEPDSRFPPAARRPPGQARPVRAAAVRLGGMFRAAGATLAAPGFEPDRGNLPAGGSAEHLPPAGDGLAAGHRAGAGPGFRFLPPHQAGQLSWPRLTTVFQPADRRGPRLILPERQRTLRNTLGPWATSGAAVGSETVAAVARSLWMFRARFSLSRGTSVGADSFSRSGPGHGRRARCWNTLGSPGVQQISCPGGHHARPTRFAPAETIRSTRHWGWNLLGDRRTGGKAHRTGTPALFSFFWRWGRARPRPSSAGPGTAYPG